MVKSFVMVISGLLCSLLMFFPSLDMACSRLLYNNDLISNQIIKLIFNSIPIAIAINFIGCGVLFVYNKYKIDKTIIYIVIAGLLGPGLIVNTCLKDHMGRARPREIIEFSGIKKFTKVFAFSNECGTNCSFPSGHAAFAYYLTAWSIVFNKRKNTVFLLFIIFGAIVGLGRIIQGGHFLSDVVASCFIVLIVNWLLFKLLNPLSFDSKQYKSI